MQRLTARDKHGNAYLVNVKEDEQEVDSPYPNTLQCILDCFSRLVAYEDAEEQGRLITLPCAVGDTVYVINVYCSNCENTEEFAKVIDVGVSCPIAYTPKCAMQIDEESFALEHYEDFGKAVFLTREEAESALAERRQSK